MTGPVVVPLGRRRTAAVVVRELHGRINLAMSLCSHREWCPVDQVTVDLIRRALLGASIDELRKEGSE